MKYTFVIALFVGVISARTHQMHAPVPGVTFYNYVQEGANASDSESSDDDEDLQTGDVFTPFDKGMLGDNEYKRVIPAHFSGDGDDIFMRSVYTNYALEGKDDDGKPTGKFSLDETQAKALATEVLGTHKGLSGGNLAKYMAAYWAKAWGHFDVNKGGSIEAIKAPQLMRFLASDQYFQL